jgi:hypothetical protein
MKRRRGQVLGGGFLERNKGGREGGRERGSGREVSRGRRGRGAAGGSLDREWEGNGWCREHRGGKGFRGGNPRRRHCYTHC